MYYVIRNSQQFGPYDQGTLKTYVEDGKVLLHDKGFSKLNPKNITTVGQLLKKVGVNISIKHKGNIFAQIKDMGRELIIPNDIFSRSEWLKDKRLLILAIIGLAPAFLIRFTLFPFLTFYAIALYFSAIWGLFFYYLFKTNQVKTSSTISIFFLSQAFVFVLFDLGRLPSWPIVSFFYTLTDSTTWLYKLVGFIFGVGFCEELVKAIPLLIILSRAKEPLIPQTMVFYGLISGIAFGVFEGVQYQTTVNTQLGYSEAFFMNISRLTSLPFLHAIWAGIAGYFIAFAALYPKYRISLFFLAIFIPALIHGMYDTLGWSLLGLFLTLLGVILLMSYLRQGVNYQSKLSK
jgi:RsiW-degrading membrane proteinase PrsW (M82 family)